MKTQRNISTIFDRLNGVINEDSNGGLSNEKLKQLVIRDLLFLLNTPSYHYLKDDAIPNEYSKSVINFGIEPISGKRVSEIDWAHVENNIYLAITLFEPRILKESLDVKCIFDVDTKAKYNQMNIEIKGFIKSIPYPERFVLHTQLDVENGNFKLAN